MSYTQFAEHYDILMGDQTDCLEFLQELIGKNTPDSVFEFGCGTGEVLQEFKNSDICHGIDISSSMVEIGRNKIPEAKIEVADISSYIFEQKYDLILAVHDVMNHILDKEQWGKIFKKVSESLSKEGEFIFDINTQYQLQELERIPTWKHNFDTNKQVQLDIRKDENNIYVFNVEVFEKIDQEPILLYTEKIRQIGVETKEIQELLSHYFRNIEMVDTEDTKIHDRSKRIYFICNNHE